VLGELVPARRGEAAAERARHLLGEPTLGEELPSRLRLGAAQLLGVELLRQLVRLDQPGSGATVALHRGAAAGIGQLDSDPVSQPFHGLDEAKVLDLHHEVDHGSAFAAAKAVEGAVPRADVERRGFLVVERAQPLERVPTGPAQRDVLADHLVDPVALADLHDVVVPDPSSHGRRV
jgi:hypothetical protein